MEAKIFSVSTERDQSPAAVAADGGTLKSNMTAVKADLGTLRADLSMIQADFADIKADGSVIKTDGAAIEIDVVLLKRMAGFDLCTGAAIFLKLFLH